MYLHPVETPTIYRVIFHEPPSMHKLDRYLRSVVVMSLDYTSMVVVVVVQKREVCHMHFLIGPPRMYIFV